MSCFFICDTCGKNSADISQHHILPRGLGGTDLSTNLCHICYDCHNLIHNRPNGFSSNLIKIGLKKLTDLGHRLGPPIKVTKEHIEFCKLLREFGKSYEQIAKQSGLSVGTVHKICNQKEGD